jgi:hypothetical protein
VVERHRTGTGTRTMKTADTRAERILTQFVEKGRYNFNKNGRALKIKELGYIVSRAKGLQIQFNSQDLTDYNFKDLETLINRLTKDIKPKEFIGLWLDNGILYIDLSRVILSLENAKELGRANKQQAIYDLKNKKTIYL